MISFDQVLLLQQKVESAVQKIVQLKAENDALRRQCSELTNALSEKSELLETFSSDEQKIERSILSALNRLNTIENSLENSIVSQSNISSVATTENLQEETKSDEIISTPNTDLQNSDSQNQNQSPIEELDSINNLNSDKNETQNINNILSDNHQHEQKSSESHQENLFELSSENEEKTNEELDDDDSTEGKKFDIF